MSRRTYADYIKLERIEEFVKGLSFDEFVKDTKMVYAVIRCFEIIGE